MVENSAALFRGGKGVLKHPEDRVHVGAVVQRETLDLLIGQPARRKPVSHKLSADSLVKEGHRATTPLRAAHPAVEASRATRSAFPEPTDGGSASRPPRARREIRQLADHLLTKPPDFVALECHSRSCGQDRTDLRHGDARRGSKVRSLRTLSHLDDSSGGSPRALRSSAGP
jgi:hypothetical protein